MQKYLQVSFGSQGQLMSFLGKIKQLKGYSRDASIIFQMVELKKFEAELIRNQRTNCMY